MVVDPGVVLETAAAAEVIGRPVAFVAKRLENATIPLHRQSVTGQSDQVRIPDGALRAWLAVMQTHKLLD